MEFTKQEHEKWFARLRGTAVLWSNANKSIAIDEAYSELLLAYGTACVNYDPERGASFEQFFYFYREKAFRSLIRHGSCDTLDDISMFGNNINKEALSVVLFRLDVRSLHNDASVVLDYILDKGIKKASGRMGMRTVVAELMDEYAWTKARATKATNLLCSMYREYCVA